MAFWLLFHNSVATLDASKACKAFEPGSAAQTMPVPGVLPLAETLKLVAKLAVIALVETGVVPNVPLLMRYALRLSLRAPNTYSIPPDELFQ